MSIDEDKEAAIRGLHSYEDELVTQIKTIRENLHHVRRSIELLSGETDNIVPLSGTITAMSSSSGDLTVSTRYSNLKGQAAVQLFLRENPDNWYKASEVAKELIRRGTPKTSKAFGSAIAGALNRAVRKGLVEREKRDDGVLRYRWAQTPNEPLLISE